LWTRIRNSSKPGGRTRTEQGRVKKSHLQLTTQSPSGEATLRVINGVAEDEAVTREAVHRNAEAEEEVAVVSREDEEDHLEPATIRDTWDVPETLVDDRLLLKTRTCGFTWFSFCGKRLSCQLAYLSFPRKGVRKTPML
jgi:hypothetical protein